MGEPDNEQQSLTEQRKRLLSYWILERRSILWKKQTGVARPWTADAILRDYRFTNVQREHDAVTIWVNENIRQPLHDHPNLVGAVVLARLLNNPNTLSELNLHTGEWDHMEFREILKLRRERGLRVLNPAYVVTTCGVKMDKLDYIVDVAEDVKNNLRLPADGDTLEDYFKLLRRIHGMGSFLSAQVVADLKNTSSNPLRKATDWWTWAAVGPGSRKGLRAVLGGPDIAESQFLGLATKLYADIQEIQGKPLNICMQDFQNCLCEFSKYWRAYNGDGRPKQRYDGR